MDSRKIDLQELEAYLTGFWLTDLSNFSAFLFQAMADLNWVGFYLSDGMKLRLGPFIGKPACMEIGFGKGACGESFKAKKSLIVDDVESFPGHIRCDSASRSEMVIPFFIAGELMGVLDLDSPSLNRFLSDDLIQVEKALELLSRKVRVPFKIAPTRENEER